MQYHCRFFNNPVPFVLTLTVSRSQTYDKTLLLDFVLKLFLDLICTSTASDFKKLEIYWEPVSLLIAYISMVKLQMRLFTFTHLHRYVFIISYVFNIDKRVSLKLTWRQSGASCQYTYIGQFSTNVTQYFRIVQYKYLNNYFFTGKILINFFFLGGGCSKLWQKFDNA